MGDISAEPSMEDILSSIKRIIAEENDAPARGKRPARPAQRPEPFDDEILELSEQASESDFAPESPPVPVPAAEAPAEPPVVPAEPLLSARTAEASRGPLDALSRMIVKPDTAGSDTLEGMVREMLRPMLREWLDAHLPALVEQMVAREIERITGR